MISRSNSQILSKVRKILKFLNYICREHAITIKRAKLALLLIRLKLLIKPCNGKLRKKCIYLIFLTHPSYFESKEVFCPQEREKAIKIERSFIQSVNNIISYIQY